MVAMIAQRLLWGCQAMHTRCPEWQESRAPLAEWGSHPSPHMQRLERQLSLVVFAALARPCSPTCQHDHHSW